MDFRRRRSDQNRIIRRIADANYRAGDEIAPGEAEEVIGPERGRCFEIKECRLIASSAIKFLLAVRRYFPGADCRREDSALLARGNASG